MARASAGNAVAAAPNRRRREGEGHVGQQMRGLACRPNYQPAGGGERGGFADQMIHRCHGKPALGIAAAANCVGCAGSVQGSLVPLQVATGMAWLRCGILQGGARALVGRCLPERRPPTRASRHGPSLPRRELLLNCCFLHVSSLPGALGWSLRLLMVLVLVLVVLLLRGVLL